MRCCSMSHCSMSYCSMRCCCCSSFHRLRLLGRCLLRLLSIRRCSTCRCPRRPACPSRRCRSIRRRLFRSDSRRLLRSPGARGLLAVAWLDHTPSRCPSGAHQTSPLRRGCGGNIAFGCSSGRRTGGRSGRRKGRDGQAGPDRRGRGSGGDALAQKGLAFRKSQGNLGSPCSCSGSSRDRRGSIEAEVRPSGRRLSLVRHRHRHERSSAQAPDQGTQTRSREAAPAAPFAGMPVQRCAPAPGSARRGAPIRRGR